MQRRLRWAKFRNGNSNRVLVVLLAGILVALVVLIGVIIAGRGGSHPGAPSGASLSSGDQSGKPAHKPVGDPNRIKETLKAGRTYRATLKTGFTCRVEDEDWGIQTAANMIYEAEMAVNRKIETNDGQRVVELRHFESSRNVKLLTTVDDINFDFGVLGDLTLFALESYQPGSTAVIGTLQPLVTGMIRNSAQQVLQGQATKAVGHVDSLSGKTVRITYADGVGVQSVEPVGCTLTEQELGFLEATAVLSDCHLMDLKINPGGTWTVDAGQLAGLIDSSLRGVPTGTISIRREQDTERSGVQTAVLQIVSGLVAVNASDNKQQRIGRLVPKGTLSYNLAENYIQDGHLQGNFLIETVSNDHILFKARMQAEPKLLVVYTCQLK